MPNVRFFDGTDDQIQISLGAIPTTPTAPFTMAVIFKRHSSSTGNDSPIQIIGSGGSEANLLYVTSAGVPTWYNNTADSQPAAMTLGLDEWWYFAVDKANGTVAPRFHSYRYGTGVWQHVVGATALANSPSLATGHVKLGGAGSNALMGWILAAGFWDVVLSDAEHEALELTFATWDDAPVGDALWRLDQANVADDVLDQTAGGANENSITGTTVESVVYPTGWVFDPTVLVPSYLNFPKALLRRAY